jgi:hypothetical protein
MRKYNIMHFMSIVPRVYSAEREDVFEERGINRSWYFLHSVVSKHLPQTTKRNQNKPHP